MVSVETWRTEISNFIPKLLDGEINEKNAILLNALFGLKRQFSYIADENTDSSALMNNAVKYEPQDTKDIDHRLEIVDFIPHSRIDNLKQESLIQFIEYMKQKGLEQTSDAPEYHGELAESAIKKMLKIDEQIAEMLYKSADKQEKDLIKNSYKQILKDIDSK